MPAGSSPFPPIADYGFLSDCRTVALVAPNGSVEWMCAGAHEHVIGVEEEAPARGAERASRASGVFTPPLMDPR
jgi:hypothetical protein